MGSGNSRLNGRLEDFRKRRNGQATLSKKQLLKDSPEEEEEEEEEEDVRTSHSSNKTEKKEANNDNKVIIMTKDIQVQPIIKEETVVQVTTTTTITTIEKLSRIVPISISECEIKEEKEKEPIKDNVEHVKKEIDSKVVDDADEKVKETEIKTEEGNVAVENVEEIVKPESNEEELTAKNEEVNAKIDDDNDSDDDDDDDENEENGRLLCPGSPSFRIYFVESEKRKEEEEEKCESSTIVVHQKSRSADSVVDSTAPRRISNEVNGAVEMASRTKRKGKGMKKFGPVRSLMKVKSCYYPMCACTGEERGRVNVIAAKAVN